ncbi:MAG TPA: sialidase family protein [Cyclobacteriaceae bacterium]|nr:sialidase family protein [Cyclobacteriaceae bacterium]
MKEIFSALFVLFLFTNSFSQFKNIKLAEQTDDSYPPVEPSIAINKLNPNNIVAGIVLNRVVVSNDGGQTWKSTELTSPFGVYGDPAVISNSKGNLFYFHLADPSGKGRGNDSWLDRIVCHTSLDQGATWNSGVSIGNNPPTDQDKAWPAVHPKKNEVVVTWTQFDTYGSKEEGCQSNIQFSRSGGGSRFSKAVQVNEIPGDCLDDDNTAMGAMAAIGNDGKIYVTWANKGAIYMDRSYDDGSTWLSSDIVVTKQLAGWNLSVDGIQRSNGLPVLAIDNSPSRFQGTLHLLWADQTNGPDDTDIWMINSRSRGDLWSKPLRVNKDETGTHQFLPWMTVDQTNGNVYVVYYDRRNSSDLQTDLYLAYSFDGGNNFSEVKISETPFTPDATKFFGDYTNIDAHAGIITPIWTRMDNGKTSVWTAIIKESDLPKPAPVKK